MSILAQSTDHYRRVRAIMVSTNRPVRDVPELPSSDEAREICLELLKHAVTLASSLGLEIYLGPGKKANQCLSANRNSLTAEAEVVPTLELAVEAASGVLFAATAALVACGVPDKPVLETWIKSVSAYDVFKDVTGGLYDTDKFDHSRVRGQVIKAASKPRGVDGPQPTATVLPDSALCDVVFREFPDQPTDKLTFVPDESGKFIRVHHAGEPTKIAIYYEPWNRAEDNPHGLRCVTKKD